jgi:hypothetical protein
MPSKEVCVVFELHGTLLLQRKSSAAQRIEVVGQISIREDNPSFIALRIVLEYLVGTNQGKSGGDKFVETWCSSHGMPHGCKG